MTHDIAIVGGGLQGGMIALSLLARRPEARVAIVERDVALGGNHTWCFNEGDVPPSAAAWLAPLVVRRWPGSEVRFPRRRRTLALPYAAVTAERLAEVVTSRLEAAPSGEVLLGAEVSALEERGVVLADGRRLEARLVVDARGPERPPPGVRMAFQKFVGLEVSLEAPHGLELPILMDATVPQRDGFRFLYLLPFGPRELLAEETYFSPTGAMDREALRRSVLDYLDGRGMAVREVHREEHGVLPMPWDAWHEPPGAAGPLRAGYRGGFFHPATGYSFGPAARLADAIGAAGPEGALAAARALGLSHERRARFPRLLNRMVFRGWPPSSWWEVFEWFYRLDEGIVGRFYALETTPADGARIFLGLPPRRMSVAGMMAG